MSPSNLVFLMVISTCNIAISKAATNEMIEPLNESTALKFSCGSQCQKKVLFDVTCKNGEGMVTRYENGVSGMIDKLHEKITKLGTLFDNSSEEGSTKKIDILAIEEQVNTLEHKVDNLLEQLIAQFNQSHA